MRLIVFDLDGTLIDSGAFITNVIRDAFVAENLSPPSDQDARSIIGLSLETAMERLSGLAGPARERLVTAYRRIYHQSALRQGNQPLFAGVHAMLDTLYAHDGTLMAIATGKSRAGLEHVLDMHGIRDRFVTLETADNHPSKPDPEMLVTAMNVAGVAPDHTVMVGDTSYDMEMARNAGCFALGVTWGYHRPQVLRQAGAHALVVNVGNLDAAINSLVLRQADA